MNFSFTLNLRAEVPELHRALLSCDFIIEDILDVTNSLRCRCERCRKAWQEPRSRHVQQAPNERSTTASSRHYTDQLLLIDVDNASI